MATTGPVAMTPVALADTVKNQVATGGGVGGNRTLDLGSTITVPYRMQATGGTGDARHEVEKRGWGLDRAGR